MSFLRKWYVFVKSSKKILCIPYHYLELEIYSNSKSLTFFWIVIWNICFGDLKNASHFPKKLTMIETYFGFMRLEDMKNLGHIALIA